MWILRNCDTISKMLHDNARRDRQDEIKECEVEDENFHGYNVVDVVMRRRKFFEIENELDKKWCFPYLVKIVFPTGCILIEDLG